MSHSLQGALQRSASARCRELLTFTPSAQRMPLHVCLLARVDAGSVKCSLHRQANAAIDQ